MGPAEAVKQPVSHALCGNFLLGSTQQILWPVCGCWTCHFASRNGIHVMLDLIVVFGPFPRGKLQNLPAYGPEEGVISRVPFSSAWY